MPESAFAAWRELAAKHAAIAQTKPAREHIPAHEPKVAVLACSDARVPPSLLFGQSEGDLFTVRLAGNSATPGAIASLTYAVEHLGVELVVVLGHTGCGAVAAALDAATPAEYSPIVAPIDEMLARCDTCESLDEAVAANVGHNLDRIARDRGPLGQAIADGRVTLVGAVHDLRTGGLIEIGEAGVDPSTEPTTSAGTSTVTPTDPQQLRSVS